MATDEVSSETKALQPHTRGVPNCILEDDLLANISIEVDNDDLSSSTLLLSDGYSASPSGGDDLFGKFPLHSLFSSPLPFNQKPYLDMAHYRSGAYVKSV